MAQRTEVIITCDLCPEPGRPVLDTYSFSLGPEDYAIEMCAEHKVSFDLIMSPYISNARRVTGPRVKRDRKSESAQLRRDARLWGITSGKPVSKMGRISAALMTDYLEYLRAGHEKSPAGRVA